MAIDPSPQVAIPQVDVKASASADVAADEVIKGLKLAGACIIRNLYDEATMAKFDEEVTPFISDAGNTTCEDSHL